MTLNEVQIVPMGSALGAEVRGLDLRQPLSAEIVRHLRAAFLEHCVVLNLIADKAPDAHVRPA